MTVNPRVGWATAISLVAMLSVVDRPAHADYIFTPFIGPAFAGRTAFLNLEQGVGSSHVIFGGQVGWLSSGILGVEGDFAFSPRFFERDGLQIPASTLTTWSGSVIVATPLRVTGYSLRPYLTGGLGLIHSSITYSLALDPVDDNSLGMNIGVGAIGLLTPRTGLRFELRHFRTFSRDQNEFTGEPEARLSFWRATIGVLIRH